MNKLIRSAFAALLVAAAGAGLAQGPIPSFEATSLTGQTVTAQALIGQPTVLIVTPSRDAAQETRQWVEALRKNIDQGKVRVRDVLALDLPFFISEQDALGRAREKIPQRYHDQTWLMNEGPLEEALNVPASSEDAFVLVLNAQGQVVARAKGQPTQRSIQEIQNAVQKLTG